MLASKDKKVPRQPAPVIRGRAGRPTREQAELRHAELLDRALDMFLDKGYELTTIEAIAASVNMTKRTVYARYTDKAALFRAAVQQAIEHWIVPDETLRSLETDDLESTLIAIARMRIAHVMTPQGMKLQRIINTESYRFPDIFNAAYEQTSKPVITFLANLLRRHAAKGTVNATRPHMAAIAFLSVVVSGPLRILTSGNKLAAKDIEDRITFSVGLFLDGVRTRKDESAAR